MRRNARGAVGVLAAIVVGACSTAPPPSAVPSLMTPSGGASAAATPAAAVAGPGATASPGVPTALCSDRPLPGWFAPLAKDQDGVADPAGRIVFGAIVRDDVAGQIAGALYSIDPDGTDIARLLTCDVERPRISPDGRRLAFSIVMSDGTWQIATAAMDGTDLEVLTSTTGYAQWPDWMPDGRSIVYSEASELCDMAVDCANVRHLLWQMDSDGGNKRQIGDPDIFYTEARISPDGTAIVFDSYDPATDSYGFKIRELATGEERRVTTTNTTDITHPDWTPDGRSIIYNTNGDGTNGIGQQLEVVPADDPNAPPVHVYGDLQHDAFKAYFSPDGSRIVFGCGLPICTMNADGSSVEILVEAMGVQLNQPAWGVSVVSE